MDLTYSVTFINHSNNLWDICIYQKDDNIGVPNVFSLAWLTSRSHPGDHHEFNWNLDYNFVWADTGELAPGVCFVADQSLSADLSTSNQITFTQTRDSCYTFCNQTKGPGSGSLFITEDSTITTKRVAVGIGMNGIGTFVIGAQPNNNLIFTPQPEFWICFGDFEQGQVLDLRYMNNAAQIKFADHIYAKTVILNADNTWTISPR